MKAQTQPINKDSLNTKVTMSNTGYKRETPNIAKPLHYSFQKNPNYLDQKSKEITVKPF
jgi:hypothetical protein